MKNAKRLKQLENTLRSKEMANMKQRMEILEKRQTNPVDLTFYHGQVLKLKKTRRTFFLLKIQTVMSKKALIL